MHRILQPDGWAKPVGYSNGISARGRQIFVGGQVGWTGEARFETDDLAGQVRQALENVVGVLDADGAGPEHIVSMTWYFIDRDDYLANLKRIGEAYREVMGRHYPVMAAMQVVALVEERAKVEIQAIAVVPD
jgi:enamine deaminase RidA (YjgF/YER057c/UK114 family)